MLLYGDFQESGCQESELICICFMKTIKSPLGSLRYKKCMVICNMNDSLNLLLIRKRKREILAITLQTLTCQVLLCMEIALLLQHPRGVKGSEVNLVLLLRVRLTKRHWEQLKARRVEQWEKVTEITGLLVSWKVSKHKSLKKKPVHVLWLWEGKPLRYFLR